MPTFDYTDWKSALVVRDRDNSYWYRDGYTWRGIGHTGTVSPLSALYGQREGESLPTIVIDGRKNNVEAETENTRGGEARDLLIKARQHRDEWRDVADSTQKDLDAAERELSYAVRRRDEWKHTAEARQKSWQDENRARREAEKRNAELETQVTLLSGDIDEYRAKLEASEEAVRRFAHEQDDRIAHAVEEVTDRLNRERDEALEETRRVKSILGNSDRQYIVNEGARQALEALAVWCDSTLNRQVAEEARYRISALDEEDSAKPTPEKPSGEDFLYLTRDPAHPDDDALIIVPNKGQPKNGFMYGRTVDGLNSVYARLNPNDGIWEVLRMTPVEAENPDDGYCPVCLHLKGYETRNGDKGCSMPLNASGQPVGHNEKTMRTCGCTYVRTGAPFTKLKDDPTIKETLGKLNEEKVSEVSPLVTWAQETNQLIGKAFVAAVEEYKKTPEYKKIEAAVKAFGGSMPK